MIKVKVDRLSFARDVASIVRAIPAGKVLSYGDVAALAGYPSHSRMVGTILGSIGFDSDTPCHRVVNSQGRCAPHWHSQRKLLENEGVIFTPSGNVDMKSCRWLP